jgi:hypothetical protein
MLTMSIFIGDKYCIKSFFLIVVNTSILVVFSEVVILSGYTSSFYLGPFRLPLSA